MLKITKERFYKARKLWFLLAGFTLFCLGIYWMGKAGFGIGYNITPSLPKGIYVKWPVSLPLEKGMIVEFPIPETVRELIISRGWMSREYPLLKPVAGLPGDIVCVEEGHLTINGEYIADVFSHDSKGLEMPVKQGCYELSEDEFLPISTYSLKSFDGRYYGPVPIQKIFAQAKALWLIKE